MSLHLTPSSDWDGWTPPDRVNMDQLSDIPTLGNVSDINELSSVIAEAAGPTSRRKKRRRPQSTMAVSDINDLSSVIAEAAGPTSRRKKRRRTLSTTAVAAGPASRRKKRRRTLSTTATVAGPTSRRRKKAGRMIRTSKGGLWLDSRATLHSIVSKLSYAKVPLVRLLRR